MNGVSRGARLWGAPDGKPVAVIVLDRGPEGWWVSIEGEIESNGHPRTVQIPARQLFGSKGNAEMALAAKR
jgi:hypothetical protein